MGFYREAVLPRLLDQIMSGNAMRESRARARAELCGEVVEIGFGTGLNAPYCPPEVTRVFAVEPSALCTRVAQPRIDLAATPVELAGLDGERLELASEAFDAVLSTGRCARSRLSKRRSPRSDGCCGRAARSTSSSTGWRYHYATKEALGTGCCSVTSRAT